MLIVHGVAKSPVINACGLHTHDCWEVILNLSGEGMELIGTEEAPFYPGSVAVCPPLVPHTKRCAPGNSWQDVYFRFSDDTFRLSRFRFTDNSDHTLQNLFELLQSACARQDSGGERFCASLGESVCALLTELDKQPLRDELVERLKSELSLRFSDPEFTPRQAMSGMGYCEDYLRRRFRRETGLTPTDYLTSLRLAHARMLLSRNGSSVMPIREVALLSGFYDADYFSRVFRRETGLSPREYQQAREAEKQAAPPPRILDPCQGYGL